jgi:MerR family mercuric resistance operon transcriptional regulator
MEYYSIGQLAEAAGVKIETIRYYERRGLIPEPPRNQSGHRKFPEKTLIRVQFIKKSQKLGFSLKEVSELLALRTDGDASCGDVVKRFDDKIKDIESRISSLQEIKTILENLSSRCTGTGSSMDCPFLHELENLNGDFE